MNKYCIIIIIILIFSISRKIYKLNKPFDETRFIKQMENQKKLKEKFSLDNIKLNLPKITSYIVGIV